MTGSMHPTRLRCARQQTPDRRDILAHLAMGESEQSFTNAVFQPRQYLLNPRGIGGGATLSRRFGGQGKRMTGSEFGQRRAANGGKETGLGTGRLHMRLLLAAGHCGGSGGGWGQR